MLQVKRLYDRVLRRPNKCQRSPLFFVDLRLFQMKLRLQLDFGNFRFAQHAVERRQISALEFTPALQHVSAFVFRCRQRFHLRGSWFRIHLPQLSIQSAGFSVDAAESDLRRTAAQKSRRMHPATAASFFSKASTASLVEVVRLMRSAFRVARESIRPGSAPDADSVMMDASCVSA